MNKLGWRFLKKCEWVKFWYPEQPSAATWEDWGAFHKKQKERPVAYFMAETLPKWLNVTFVWPYTRRRDAISDYLFKQPVIKIRTLAPGWHDKDTTMLHANFQLLVDYVEIENAYMQLWCHSDLQRPNWFVKRFTDWRNADLGIKHLTWAASLTEPTIPEYVDGTPQAHAAKEALELYTWWKSIRPNRIEADVVSGYSEYCKERITANPMDDDSIWSWGSRDDSERAEVKTYLDKMTEIENQYDTDDEEMLIRLIKIRKSLWT